jgi:hypothetical protein
MGQPPAKSETASASNGNGYGRAELHEKQNTMARGGRGFQRGLTRLRKERDKTDKKQGFDPALISFGFYRR